LGIRKEEKGAVARTEFDLLSNEPVGSEGDLVKAMQAVQDIHISEVFIDHVVELVNRTRVHPALEVGCSPRAGICCSRRHVRVGRRYYLAPYSFEL